ncbi:hypothetical protein BASA50_001120 [Batrachochytrium salamandrivorans]|uniref:Uncharacterized protein n=1 Tax=Batrachochytrium salamandrivorans TaxID=1357716 RepID=A0ABQ8ESQ6_9FUNG|nr:hypothetical protein BASA50_001120 [Batrachochytrium salamandrivorans]
MQFFTIVISAITVIASVHGATIPALDAPASPQMALEARSYNDPDSGSNLEKRSPGMESTANLASITSGMEWPLSMEQILRAELEAHGNLPYL